MKLLKKVILCVAFMNGAAVGMAMTGSNSLIIPAVLFGMAYLASLYWFARLVAEADQQERADRKHAREREKARSGKIRELEDSINRINSTINPGIVFQIPQKSNVRAGSVKSDQYLRMKEEQEGRTD